MWTVVEINKKQYFAKEGEVLSVERMSTEGKCVLDKILLTAEGDSIRIGTPYVEGVRIEAEVLEEKKEKKVLIYKYKRRKKYRRKQGHRQIKTFLKILKILS